MIKELHVKSINIMNKNTLEDINVRKMSIYWLTFLLANGINMYPVLDKKGRIVKRIAAVYPSMMLSLWVIITVSGITALLFDSYDNQQMAVTLAYVMGSGSTLVQLIICLYKRPAMYKMMSIMRDEFWYDGDRRKSSDHLYRRFVRTYGAVFPVANVMMCTAPLAWVFQHNANINSPNAYIFHVYMPWKITVPVYVVIYCYQYVISLCVLANLTGMVLSMIVFVYEMQVQVDILVNTINELDVDDMYSGGKLDPEKTHPAYGGLVKCIKHHQTLITFFDHFKSYFNVFFGFEVVYILIMTCMSAGSLLLFKGIHVNMMALLTIVVSQYFFLCLIGEQFASMNSQIGDSVYFKFLKCKCPKLAKLGLLIVLRTQKPLQLTAMGISKYTASLFTFTVTMKSAYAGINVFRKTLK